MAQDFKVSYEFGEEGTSEIFQQNIQGLLSTGIYGELTENIFSIESDKLVINKPLTYYFTPYVKSSVIPLNRGAKVLASSSSYGYTIEETMTVEKPYVVAEFNWENWGESVIPFSITYKTRLEITQSSPNNYISQIIIGRIIFDSGVYSSIDFSETTFGRKREMELSYNMGRIVPNFSSGQYTGSVDIVFDEPIKRLRNEDFNASGSFFVDGKKYITSDVTLDIMSDFPVAPVNDQVCIIYATIVSGGISYLKSAWFDDTDYPTLTTTQKVIILGYVFVPTGSTTLSMATIEQVNNYNIRYMIPATPQEYFRSSGKATDDIIPDLLDEYLEDITAYGTVEKSSNFTDHPISDFYGNEILGSFTFSVMYKTITRIKAVASGLTDNSIWEGMADWDNISGVSSNWIWKRFFTSSDTVYNLSSEITGLSIENSITDLDNDLSFGIGSCADSTRKVMLGLESSIIKSIDALWTLGTGGGLDVGTVLPSSSYFSYLIVNDITKVGDIILSLSSIIPTLPADYTYYRKIGYFSTDSSSKIVQGTWIREKNILEFWFKDLYNPIVSVSPGVGTGYSILSPINVSCKVLCHSELHISSTSPNTYGKFYTGLPGILNSLIVSSYSIGNSAVTLDTSSQFITRTDLTSKIYFKVTNVTGDPRLNVFVVALFVDI